MRTIQTTYSLEPFISRLPSVYPSYNGSDELLCFDKDSIDKRDGRYTSNYGMVPINIPFNKLLNTINQNNDYKFDDTSYICKHQECQEWYISWSTFSEWFSFFKNYYRILNDCGSCGRVYSSATDFYDYEYKSSSSRNLPLGNDRESYDEYDKLFAKRGGKCDDNSKGTIVKHSDIGLFKLINDYIVPSFEIPHEFTNYWNTDKIYYPNVIRWISWLDIRKDYPTELDKCSERHDCCDCEEYIQRGGSSLLESLKTWYKATNSKVELINKLIKDNINDETWHFKPHIVKEISILNTFEKSSQQSILSEVYDTNIDFRGVKSYSDNVNNNSGTTVVVEEKSMLLTANSSGNKFDEKYMEKVYDDDAFTEYYDIYINGNGKDIDEHGKDFTSDYPWYGVNSNNVKKYGKTEDEVKYLFCDRLDIERNGTYGWFLIDNDLTEVVPIETISMKDGSIIPVFREEGTNTPYVTIGGSDIYATYNFKMNKYYFSFNKDVGFDRNKLSESDYCYIRYNSNITIIKSSDKKVTYTLSNGDKISYGRVDGYSYDTNGDILYVVGNDVCTSFSIDNDGNVSYVKKDKASIEGDIIIIRHDDIETSLCDFISGTTSSKLLELRAPNIMTDDNGNMIHAMNVIGSTDRPKGIYAQPNIGEELEPLYQVGNVSSISPFKLTYENYNKDDKKLTFIGNIISKMEFYYTDGDNKKINVQVDVKKDDGTYEQKPSVYITSIEKGELKSSLEAIKKTRDVIEIYKRNFPVNVVSDNIHCDITYHIGATLNRIGNDYFLAEEYNSFSDEKYKDINGVTYTESVEFVKNKEEYYLGSDKVSYPVYVYEMLQNDSYIATFKAQINTYSSTTEENSGTTKESEIESSYSKIESSYSKKDDMDSHNGLDAYPTYQEAYNIGVVSSPIIDSNVNIYRGNNAAFEKHLKLGEVTSLEALENYTNGYFNMIET